MPSVIAQADVSVGAHHQYRRADNAELGRYRIIDPADRATARVSAETEDGADDRAPVLVEVCNQVLDSSSVCRWTPEDEHRVARIVGEFMEWARIPLRGLDGAGVRQEPPLPVSVEMAQARTAGAQLAHRIGQRIREKLIVAAEVDLVPWGSLERSQYKSTLLRTG